MVRTFWRPNQPIKKARARLHVEELEARRVLSFVGAPDALLGGDTHGSGPAFRLDIVALHEFGHSLGLAHNNDTTSIMYPYYNAAYNLANLAADSAAGTLQALYADVNTSPWKDSLDPNPGDGKVDVTYSFMPDGTRLDTGAKNTLFATMRGHFGSDDSVWQNIFTQELNRWAGVSNNHLAFQSHSDGGQKFNVFGSAQNDSHFGDIRIGAHRFDGVSKVLAHAYYPPPNGYTAAGDAHFDNAENWIDASGLLQASSTTTKTGKGGSGNLLAGSGAEESIPPPDMLRSQGSKIVLTNSQPVYPIVWAPMVRGAIPAPQYLTPSAYSFGSGEGILVQNADLQEEEYPSWDPDTSRASSLPAGQDATRVVDNPTPKALDSVFEGHESANDLFNHSQATGTVWVPGEDLVGVAMLDPQMALATLGILLGGLGTVGSPTEEEPKRRFQR